MKPAVNIANIAQEIQDGKSQVVIAELVKIIDKEGDAAVIPPILMALKNGAPENLSNNLSRDANLLQRLALSDQVAALKILLPLATKENLEKKYGSEETVFHYIFSSPKITETEKTELARLVPQNILKNLLAQKDEDGITPMHHIAKAGQFKLFGELMVIADEAIVAKDADDRTPIDILIESSAKTEVSSLAEFVADASAKPVTKIDILKKLQQQKPLIFADILATSDLNYLILVAAEKGEMEVAEFFLKNSKVEALQAVDSEERTLVHNVIASEEVSENNKLRFLNSIPRDVLVSSLKQFDREGATPLHRAYKSEKIIAQLLPLAGLETLARTADNAPISTLRFLLESQNKDAQIRILKAIPADILKAAIREDARVSQGKPSLLQDVFDRKEYEVLKLLLPHATAQDLTARNNKGGILINDIVNSDKRDEVPQVELLNTINTRVLSDSLNGVDSQGMTPLLAAGAMPEVRKILWPLAQEKAFAANRGVNPVSLILTSLRPEESKLMLESINPLVAPSVLKEASGQKIQVGNFNGSILQFTAMNQKAIFPMFLQHASKQDLMEKDQDGKNIFHHFSARGNAGSKDLESLLALVAQDESQDLAAVLAEPDNAKNTFLQNVITSDGISSADKIKIINQVPNFALRRVMEIGLKFEGKTLLQYVGEKGPAEIAQKLFANASAENLADAVPALVASVDIDDARKMDIILSIQPQFLEAVLNQTNDDFSKVSEVVFGAKKIAVEKKIELLQTLEPEALKRFCQGDGLVHQIVTFLDVPAKDRAKMLENIPADILQESVKNGALTKAVAVRENEVLKILLPLASVQELQNSKPGLALALRSDASGDLLKAMSAEALETVVLQDEKLFGQLMDNGGKSAIFLLEQTLMPKVGASAQNLLDQYTANILNPQNSRNVDEKLFKDSLGSAQSKILGRLSRMQAGVGAELSAENKLKIAQQIINSAEAGNLQHSGLLAKPGIFGEKALNAEGESKALIDKHFEQFKTKPEYAEFYKKAFEGVKKRRRKDEGFFTIMSKESKLQTEKAVAIACAKLIDLCEGDLEKLKDPRLTEVIADKISDSFTFIPSKTFFGNNAFDIDFTKLATVSFGDNVRIRSEEEQKEGKALSPERARARTRESSEDIFRKINAVQNPVEQGRLLSAQENNFEVVGLSIERGNVQLLKIMVNNPRSFFATRNGKADSGRINSMVQRLTSFDEAEVKGFDSQVASEKLLPKFLESLRGAGLLAAEAVRAPNVSAARLNPLNMASANYNPFADIQSPMSAINFDSVAEPAQEEDRMRTVFLPKGDKEAFEKAAEAFAKAAVRMKLGLKDDQETPAIAKTKTSEVSQGTQDRMSQYDKLKVYAFYKLVATYHDAETLKEAIGQNEGNALVAFLGQRIARSSGVKGSQVTSELSELFDVGGNAKRVTIQNLREIPLQDFAINIKTSNNNLRDDQIKYVNQVATTIAAQCGQDKNAAAVKMIGRELLNQYGGFTADFMKKSQEPTEVARVSGLIASHLENGGTLDGDSLGKLHLNSEYIAKDLAAVRRANQSAAAASASSDFDIDPFAEPIIDPETLRLAAERALLAFPEPQVAVERKALSSEENDYVETIAKAALKALERGVSQSHSAGKKNDYDAKNPDIFVEAIREKILRDYSMEELKADFGPLPKNGLYQQEEIAALALKLGSANILPEQFARSLQGGETIKLNEQDKAAIANRKLNPLPAFDKDAAEVEASARRVALMEAISQKKAAAAVSAPSNSEESVEEVRNVRPIFLSEGAQKEFKKAADAFAKAAVRENQRQQKLNLDEKGDPKGDIESDKSYNQLKVYAYYALVAKCAGDKDLIAAEVGNIPGNFVTKMLGKGMSKAEGIQQSEILSWLSGLVTVSAKGAKGIEISNLKDIPMSRFGLDVFEKDSLSSDQKKYVDKVAKAIAQKFGKEEDEVTVGAISQALLNQHGGVTADFEQKFPKDKALDRNEEVVRIADLIAPNLALDGKLDINILNGLHLNRKNIVRDLAKVHIPEFDIDPADRNFDVNPFAENDVVAEVKPQVVKPDVPAAVTAAAATSAPVPPKKAPAAIPPKAEKNVVVLTKSKMAMLDNAARAVVKALADQAGAHGNVDETANGYKEMHNEAKNFLTAKYAKNIDVLWKDFGLDQGLQKAASLFGGNVSGGAEGAQNSAKEMRAGGRCGFAATNNPKKIVEFTVSRSGGSFGYAETALITSSSEVKDKCEAVAKALQKSMKKLDSTTKLGADFEKELTSALFNLSNGKEEKLQDFFKLASGSFSNLDKSSQVSHCAAAILERSPKGKDGVLQFKQDVLKEIVETKNLADRFDNDLSAAVGRS